MNAEKHTAQNILETAVFGLEQWENENISVDDFLDARLPNPVLRRPVSSIIFEYFRHKSIIDRLLASLVPGPIKPRYRRLLAVAATQVLYQSGIAAASAVNVAVDSIKARHGQKAGGFINAVLRRVMSADLPAFIAGLSAAEQANLPPEIYRRWQQIYPEELPGLIERLQHRAPFTFRACRQELTAEEQQAASASRIEGLDWLTDFTFYQTTSPATVFSGDLLKKARIYIQDPATALAPALAEVQPYQQVIDLCAAPGGKALMLAEKLNGTGELIASDRSERRQQLTRENFERHGWKNCRIITASALETPFQPAGFDLVLLDAPCSNTGVFHRRPDALWNFSANKLKELKKLQRDLLEAAAKLVRPGGRLVYSTCSIEPEENHSQTESFSAAHPNFRLGVERQLLPAPLHDGAYAAVFDRSADQ